jgi:hypothetical protein
MRAGGGDRTVRHESLARGSVQRYEPARLDASPLLRRSPGGHRDEAPSPAGTVGRAPCRAPPRRCGAARASKRLHARLSVLPQVTLRCVTTDDLPTIGRWLSEPDVGSRFLVKTTAETELEKYWLRIEDPFSPTIMCMVELGGESVGWFQWCRYLDHHAAVVASGANGGDIGADHPLGEPTVVGHGVRTAMIASLVAKVSQRNRRAALGWGSRHALQAPRP